MLIILALLLGSTTPPTAAAPAPVQPACAQATAPQSSPAAVTLHGTVSGPYASGVIGPLGVYEAYGDTVAQAEANAACEAEKIRTQATAQAVRP
jgi:hypothetical protein